MPRRTPPSCQIAAGSLNPSCQSGASRFFPLRSPVRVHLVPGFRFLLFLRPLFLPRPLPTVLFSTVASIAESHNAWSKLFCATTQSTYSNASRSPPARSNRFRPCVVFGLLFSDFFFLFFFSYFFFFLAIAKRRLLIGPLATVDISRIKWRSSAAKLSIASNKRDSIIGISEYASCALNDCKRRRRKPWMRTGWNLPT